jgi:hypothetical protein
MTIAHILFPIISSLAVNECVDVSPWVARKLVRWYARRRYAPPVWAEVRAEELAALVNDCPGKLFKLITALSFAVKAIVTRKVGPGGAQLTTLWQPTMITVHVCYENRITAMSDDRAYGHPKALAVHQAWCRLTAEVRNAAKEAGVGSRSWRRGLKELIRVTGDDRWTLVSRNLDHLEQINCSRAKLYSRELPARSETSLPITQPHDIISSFMYYWSFPADSTITHYETAVEIAQAEIRRLTGDFLPAAQLLADLECALPGHGRFKIV